MADEYKVPGIVGILQSDIWVVLLRILLFTSIAVFVLGGYAVARFHGLKSCESMELAHVARNLASGQGYTTLSITPFDEWFLKAHGFEQRSNFIPDIHHAPGYPVLLSSVFRLVRPAYNVSKDFGIFDAEYMAVVPLGIILTLLSAAVLFAFGRRLFGLRIAGLASAIYLISNLTLSYMISGLPIPMLSLAVTLVCMFAISAIQLSASGGHTIKYILLVCGCAISAAIAVLTDYTMIAVAGIVLLLFVLQLQRLRWTSVLLFAVLVGVLVSPWLLHNHKLGIGVLAAKQYDAVAESSLYQDNTLARSVEPKFNSYRVGGAIKRKIIHSIAETSKGTKAASGGVIVCFFVLALFHRFNTREVNSLKWMILATLGLLLFLMPLIGSSYTTYAALFPMIILIGASAFDDYVNREEFFEQGLPQLLMWALIIFSALPAGLQILKGADHPYPPYYAPIQKFVSGMIKKDEIIYTDIPWATAWYGNRESMLLPQDIKDVVNIKDGWKKVGGVYLTSKTANCPIQTESSWRNLWLQKIPKNIPLRHSIQIPANKPNQLFISDTPRWE